MQTKVGIQAVEIEELVIGSILLESDTLTRVTEILRPQCFYHERTREVFKAILSLDKKNHAIDIATVCEELKRTGKLEIVGGAYGVSTLSNKVASTAHIERHAAIIYEKFLLRELSGMGMRIHNLTNEPNADCFNILEMVQREIANIDFIGKSSVQHVGDVINEILIENRQAIENPKLIVEGIPSGFYNVDKFFMKQKQDLGIIAARPGMGKTAYMLALAKHTAMTLKKPAAIFSLEMSTKKLVNRLMASESHLSAEKIGRKKLVSNELSQLGSGVSKLIDIPLYFDDTADLDINTLIAKIRRMKREFAVEEIYIDYLQLMSGEKKGNREQEISFMTRQLKKIAKQEDIPITALSQLSRKVDERANKKPQLSDLRESGAIEQDADWVLSLFRPEYYGIESNGVYDIETFEGRHLQAKNLLIVEALKYREGDLFSSALKFYGQFMLIENYDLDPLGTQFPLKPIQQNNNFLNEDLPY